MASQEHEEIVALLKESIAASNRTNHAVRAIVLPSTIMLVAILLLFPIALIGVFASVGFALFLAGLVLLGGGVLAIRAQIVETQASAIPNDVSGSNTVPTRVMSNVASGENSSSPDQSAPASDTPASPPAKSGATCRFCGKPFPQGYWDYCPDCGKN